MGTTQGCCMGTTQGCKQILEAAPYKLAAVQPVYLPSRKLFKNNEQSMLGTAEELKTNS